MIKEILRKKKIRNEAEEAVTKLIDELFSLQRGIIACDASLEKIKCGELEGDDQTLSQIYWRKIKYQNKIIAVVEQMGNYERDFRSTF